MHPYSIVLRPYCTNFWFKNFSSLCTGAELKSLFGCPISGFNCRNATQINLSVKIKWNVYSLNIEKGVKKCEGWEKCELKGAVHHLHVSISKEQ